MEDTYRGPTYIHIYTYKLHSPKQYVRLTWLCAMLLTILKKIMTIFLHFAFVDNTSVQITAAISHLLNDNVIVLTACITAIL